MTTAQDGLADLVIRQISPKRDIAAINKFAAGIVEFVSTGSRTLNGVIDPAPASRFAGGIAPFFTHVSGVPWKEYLVIPSTIQSGDVLSLTIDGSIYSITLPAGFSATGTPVQYDGDRISSTIPNAVLVTGAGDELGGPISTVTSGRLGPGQRGLVVYEHQPPTAGGGKMFVISPNQATGIPIPAFRTVTTNPPTGTLVGEAILNTNTGGSFVWDGLTWKSIVPPSIVSYPTDSDVLTDNIRGPGTYAFSQATGNLFVRYTDTSTGASPGTDIWREIGITKRPLQTGLLGIAAADGTIGYAIDTGNFFMRIGTAWQPFGEYKDTQANILASTYADGSRAYATDTGQFWIRENGTWEALNILRDTNANIQAATSRDGTTAFATDTNQFWIRVNGAWQPFDVHQDNEAVILGTSPRDGTVAYATDTNTRYIRVKGKWQPESIIYDTEADILAMTPQSNQLAVATDNGTVWLFESGGWIALTPRHFTSMAAMIAWNPASGQQAIVDTLGLSFDRTGGRWVPKSIWTDTDAAIKARTDMLTGQMATASDTNLLYTWDGINWIGQPFRSYATEVLMDTDNPPDGVVGVSADTSVVSFRAAGAWIKANRSMMMSVQETAPTGPVAGNAWFKASTTEMKVYDGTNWVKMALGGIGDLSDVDTTTNPPRINKLMRWDGTNWVPSSAVITGGEPPVANRHTGDLWWSGSRMFIWAPDNGGVWVET